MFGFSLTKIVDPYNTMGAAQQRRTAQQSPAVPTGRRVRHPDPDEFTPDYVTPVEYLTEVPVKNVARGYGLTLDAAARFAQAWDDAHTYGASDKRGAAAVEECEYILSVRSNRQRW